MAALAAALLAGLLGGALAPVGAHAAGHTEPADFNGDGYRDAVLRVPAATVGGRESAGAVIVLYGSASGLSAKNRVLLTQDSPGVPGGAETGDSFGASTASADLDRDGYADLVVGAPYEDLPEGADKGMVTILWGSRSGLVSGRTLPTPPGDFERFGRDVAAAGKESSSRSLVIVGGWNDTKTYRGSFTRTGDFPTALAGSVSWFSSVATGDIDRNGLADTVAVSGRMGGHTGGLVFTNPVDAESHPRPQSQGDALVAAIGDVNGDGYGDVVAGDPDEPEQRGVDGELGGRVLIWYGGPNGIPKDAEPTVISQDSPGVPGSGEKGDDFGASVVVADLDRDGVGDIVVGSPHEKLGAVPSAGMVTVIPGRRTGTPGAGAYSYTQDTEGVPGGSEAGDRFGTTLSAGDVNRDGRPELIVTANGENNYAGAAWILPGGATRPGTNGSTMLTTSQFGLPASGWQLLGGDELPLL
ncbi:VCBS repeat-containing protein [Streptomyces sp. 15-116A]|uniref:VCBS repeat-containing protein n=1 Tax=Streptomyces sp. 15-116A TaxID=2259035 RepID=UPI0021B265D2|nr:VCBS repeat-containing protein [Streptomyces sp. 15-116A]MCT7352716.1 VCBS repeat-containing protein [Streptomyces sp. 15-116A]